ncbi:protein-glutamate O-methyltransferase CheR [Amphritea sp. 1_MG-2023]|uniref:CheR family methyltransferase n=1 Tax=Amphritea sp. 1_MG-2023 TaxID=3062670 RepID=UPI0026E32F0B|nr:protein-glutamate O-methyltransferase CheR [Amphritea sp. 1_MG-2023]MDO6564526.1 protein-glutamate O-methyltransferase CheR [Amphritea sp. 1_MG-2023]
MSHSTLNEGRELKDNKISITQAEFDQFCHYLENACGILLAEHKQYLVESRLGKILIEGEYGSLGQLIVVLTRPGNSCLKERVINAMTTNETLWFRDIHPYTILKEKLLPELAVNMNSQRLKIWSAACSTGQEPYSISMIIDEFKHENPGAFRLGEEIIATDISTHVLEQARAAEYEMLALGRGLSQERLKKFFVPSRQEAWTLMPKIKNRVSFRELNLLGTCAGISSCDIVFCRNVLIYFSTERKRDILTKIHKSLKPGGYLLLGASESIGDLQPLYEMIHCRPGIIYKAR